MCDGTNTRMGMSITTPWRTRKLGGTQRNKDCATRRLTILRYLYCYKGLIQRLQTRDLRNTLRPIRLSPLRTPQPLCYVIRRSIKCYAPRVGALTRWCNHTTQPQLQSLQAQGTIISEPQEWARQPGVFSSSEDDGGSLAGQSLS